MRNIKLLLAFITAGLFMDVLGFAADKSLGVSEDKQQFDIGKSTGTANKGKLRFLRDERAVDSAKATGIIVDSVSLKPKARINKTGVTFLDKDGIGTKEYRFKKEYASVETSHGAKFIGVNTVLQSDEKGGIKEAEFAMLDADGNVKWTTKAKFSRVVPSPEGSFAIGVPDPEWGGAPIFLLDSKGEQKKISEEGANRSSGPHFAISNSGNIIAVSIGQLRENPKECLGVVMDKDGNEIWRRQSDKQSCGVVPGDNNIATIDSDAKTGKSALSMYDLKGNLLWKNEDFKGANVFAFSKDSRYFFTQCALYDMATGKLLWRHEGVYGNSFTTSNFELIGVVSGKYDGYNLTMNTLQIFDRAGQLVSYQEFPVGYLAYYGSRPLISFSDSRKEILIGTSEGLKIFEIPGGE